eukprot:12936599-Prorocentrum_lima.AAC.1
MSRSFFSQRGFLPWVSWRRFHGGQPEMQLWPGYIYPPVTQSDAELLSFPVTLHARDIPPLLPFPQWHGLE